MEQKHTPGPWTAVDDTLVRGPHGESVAATKWTNYPPDPNYDANARLIAAAPDLLAALESCADYLARLPQYPDRGYDIQILLLTARAALAKAEGK